MVARNSIFTCALSVFVYLSTLTYDTKAANGERPAAGRNDAATKPHKTLRLGVASWYGPNHQGRKTASGERFDPCDFTCASWDYPFGTVLRVSYLDRFVLVRVNDRGPARRLHRAIDLSESAFSTLANPKLGLIPVTIERVR